MKLFMAFFQCRCFQIHKINNTIPHNAQVKIIVYIYCPLIKNILNAHIATIVYRLF